MSIIRLFEGRGLRAWESWFESSPETRRNHYPEDLQFGPDSPIRCLQALRFINPCEILSTHDTNKGLSILECTSSAISHDPSSLLEKVLEDTKKLKADMKEVWEITKEISTYPWKMERLEELIGKYLEVLVR